VLIGTVAFLCEIDPLCMMPLLKRPALLGEMMCMLTDPAPGRFKFNTRRSSVRKASHTGALSKEGHLIRITTKVSNVILNPLKGVYLILESKIRW
jgi:hypothetical protein